MAAAVVGLLLLAAPTVAAAGPPTTVVVVLGDDVDDTLLPLIDVMPNLKQMKQQGMTFANSFVTTAVCCPSRSSIMSGLYQHNTRCLRNSISGGCNSPWWKENIEKNRTFAYHLQQAGWRTFYGGKYLNAYAEDKEGVAHVPTGWTEWLGLRGNSVYYDYTLSNNGRPEKHGKDYQQDYLVDLLANRTAKFLRATFAGHPTDNVLAMVGTPAAHSPYDVAPQYAHDFPNASGRAPRTPNWNVGREGKHWLVGQHHVMKEGEIMFSDSTFRRRMMTLRSLDDLLGTVLSALKEGGGGAREANSWVFFTADNGFHSGQFTMPDDKRLPYEFDIRVPLVVHPPRGSMLQQGGDARGGGDPHPYPAGGCGPYFCCHGVVLNIDLAPTLLDIAGVTGPALATMDGSSYKWMIQPPAAAAAAAATPQRARRDFLVEYHGEYEHNDQYSPIRPPVWQTPPFLYFPKGVTASKQQDTTNNTYSCLRTLEFSPPAQTNTSLFCRFYANDDDWRADKQYITEFYDVGADAFQMHNAAPGLGAAMEEALRARLDALRACGGEGCSPRVTTNGF